MQESPWQGAVFWGFGWTLGIVATAVVWQMDFESPLMAFLGGAVAGIAFGLPAYNSARVLATKHPVAESLTWVVALGALCAAYAIANRPPALNINTTASMQLRTFFRSPLPELLWLLSGILVYAAVIASACVLLDGRPSGRRRTRVGLIVTLSSAIAASLLSGLLMLPVSMVFVTRLPLFPVALALIFGSGCLMGRAIIAARRKVLVD